MFRTSRVVGIKAGFESPEHDTRWIEGRDWARPFGAAHFRHRCIARCLVGPLNPAKNNILILGGTDRATKIVLRPLGKFNAPATDDAQGAML